MKLSIHQPLGYSYQGGRSNNEDNIFPAADDASQHQPWFMVCDGVGGAARGEIASHIAVESFNEYFIQNQAPVANSASIQSALDYVQAQFDDYLNRHPEAQGMATTLTLLYFHEAGATVAHIGDSRVYHLRNGKVIWRTEDHSLVNQLLKAGVITREEAREHPQRNVIERAIQGSTKAVKADVQILNDVRPGDYFFLCTDGVLERVSDELLENVLGSNATNEQKKQTLIDCCTGKTKDNFSAYLVQVETVSGEVAPEYRVPPPVYSSQEALPDETVAVVAVDSKRTASAPVNLPPPRVDSAPKFNTAPRTVSEETIPKDKPRPDSLFLLLTVALLAAILTMGGAYVYKRWQQPTKTGPSEQEGIDPEKKHDRPRKNTDRPQKNNALPPVKKPKPGSSHSLPSDPAVDAIQGISQASEALNGDNEAIEITPTLFKKEVESGWILVDEKGDPKGKKVYDKIGNPSDKFIVVQQKGKWGYITLTGKTAIACQFDRAGDFENGKAHVSQNGTEYDIDKTGKPLDSQKVEQESVHRKNHPNGHPLTATIAIMGQLGVPHS